MTYTVYSYRTKRLYKEYETLKGAKIAASRLNKTNRGEFDYMESSLFQEKHNQKVTVKNLLSGKEVQIREQDVGSVCDPSTERYWSA